MKLGILGNAILLRNMKFVDRKSCTFEENDKFRTVWRNVWKIIRLPREIRSLVAVTLLFTLRPPLPCLLKMHWLVHGASTGPATFALHNFATENW